MAKPKLATVWLDGCSGCHMSFLDMDEHLITLAEKATVVYSPLVDMKEFPPDVAVTLVEGAVSTEEDLRKIRYIRGRTKQLVSLGDCAVTGNVPSLRNRFAVEEVLERSYFETAHHNASVPSEVIPALRGRVCPVHEAVPVDLHIPGCPPEADVILFAVTELLEGRYPSLTERTRFGM